MPKQEVLLNTEQPGFCQSLLLNIDRRVDNINILPFLKGKSFPGNFNETSTGYAKNKTVVRLFEEQVKKNPGARAVVCEGEELTYSELNRRSNQLARYLKRCGVRAETLVPICLERGIEMIIGILGILKAGGAYVPINPEYPTDRINYILKDIGATLISMQWIKIA